MGQPQLLRIRFLRQPGRLVKGHVLVFPGLGLLAVLTVHAFTDEEIRILRIFGNHRHRSRIGTVRNL